MSRNMKSFSTQIFIQINRLKVLLICMKIKNKEELIVDDVFTNTFQVAFRENLLFYI